MANIATTFAAVAGGNLSDNNTYVTHHKIGLAWCGTGYLETGSCNQDPYNVGGTDVSLSYVASPSSSNLSQAVPFSVADVATIEASAMKALKNAFVDLPVIVEVASPHDQDHVVYVVGNLPSRWQTGDLLNLGASFVYYWVVSGNAQTAAGYPSGQGPDCGHSWCNLAPAVYPPQTPSDAAAFAKLLLAIGTGIGNNAAHEIGHQFTAPSLPYMDCGYDESRPGGALNCESGDNFVYEFFSGSGSEQDLSNPNSTGAQFKYVQVPGKSVKWGPTDKCELRRNILDDKDATCTQ